MESTRRRNRALNEPYEVVAFHLPVALMKRFRDNAKAAGLNYSDSATRAFYAWLDGDEPNGTTEREEVSDGGPDFKAAPLTTRQEQD
jgi:hypothetical protein